MSKNYKISNYQPPQLYASNGFSSKNNNNTFTNSNGHNPTNCNNNNNFKSNLGSVIKIDLSKKREFYLLMHARNTKSKAEIIYISEIFNWGFYLCRRKMDFF